MPLYDHVLSDAYRDAVSKHFGAFVSNLITQHPDDHSRARMQFCRGMLAINEAYEYAKKFAAPEGAAKD